MRNLVGLHHYVKAQAKRNSDFKAQPLKGVYANSEELGRDMSRYLLETLLELKYRGMRRNQVQ